MIEIPNGREIAEAYDDALAEKLIKIAGAKGVISTADFVSQLSNWAGTNRRLLLDELNYNSKPTTRNIRKELKEISKTADNLFNALVLLPPDSINLIQDNLFSHPDFDKLQVVLEDRNALLNITQSMEALSRATSITASDLRNIKEGETQRRNRVRKECVHELGIAWQMLNGEQPSRRNRYMGGKEGQEAYGDFNKFVVVALTPLFGHEKAASGIDAVIKDVINLMEKNPYKYRSVYFHI